MPDKENTFNRKSAQCVEAQYHWNVIILVINFNHKKTNTSLINISVKNIVFTVTIKYARIVITVTNVIQ